MSGDREEQTVVQTPQPSPAARRLTRTQEAIAQEQLGAIQEARGFLDTEFQDLDSLVGSLGAELERTQERASELEPIQDELLQLQLGTLRNFGQLSEDESGLIGEAIQGALETGESDIARFRDQNLEALREELAPGLGLRPSDTPILDRGARVAEEATRQQGQLASALQSQGAQLRLNFPLERDRVTSGVLQNQQAFQQSAQEFNRQLQEAAFLNRLQLAGTQGQLRLGLATGVNAQLPGTIAALTGSRQTGTTTVSPSALTLGFQGLGAAGGLAQGLGAVF